MPVIDTKASPPVPVHSPTSWSVDYLHFLNQAETMEHSPTSLVDPQDTRDKLVRLGRFQSVHWLILLGSLAITLFAWQYAKQQLESRIQIRFEREAVQAIKLVSERMRQYEVALRAGVALFDTLEADVSHAQWRTFAQRLNLDHRYPGINGVGVIYRLPRALSKQHIQNQRDQGRPGFAIHPSHTSDILLPITYVEPEPPNKEAVGLDMAHEVNRLTAANAAMSSGEATVTAPIILVQDQQKTPGFLLFVPITQREQSTGEPASAVTPVLVYAPFVFRKLMEGSLADDNRRVRLNVFDQDQVLFQEFGQPKEGSNEHVLQLERQAEMFGRTWDFQVQGDESFLTASESAQPVTILLLGILMDATLLALFLFTTRISRQALHYADNLTAELKQQTQTLQTANEELERFSYVASHDLKSPLRAIKQRAQWVVEDSEGRLPQAAGVHLSHLTQTITRMEKLLDDLLDFAQIGRRAEQPEPVDCALLVKQICADMNPPDQFKIKTEGLPILTTPRMPLQQVLSNLISNAITHHDLVVVPEITLICEAGDSYFKFSVIDNGPGIAPQHNDKVFELFQRLTHRKDGGTGIGLSIVRKWVQVMGGSISLRANQPRGTVVSFTWPSADQDHAGGKL